MKNRVLSRLFPKDPPSYPRMAEFIANTHREWEDLYDKDKPRFAPYVTNKLAHHFGISKLLDAKILKFGQHCLEWIYDTPPISSRLILCGSKASITDPQPGDTILTPEGVWQIDSDFQELLLSKKDMAKYIPEDLQPKENTPLEQLLINDDQTTDASDSPEIEKSKRLTTALNQMILAKGHGLYLSSQATKERTASIIQSVLKDQITPTIQYRGLTKPLLQKLHLKSDIQFMHLAHQYSEDCIRFFESRKVKSIENPVDADDMIEYQNALLSRRLELHHLSDAQLNDLAYLNRTYEPLFSSRIICGESRKQVSSSVTLQKGDTILLPDGILQIDYAGNVTCFLDQKAMATQSLLTQHLADTNATVTTMNTGENPKLTEALNSALENKMPSAMYIGSELKEEAKEKMDFQQTVSSVIQTELDRRQTKDLLVLKTLGLKNDAEFMHYSERLYSDFLGPWIIQNPNAPQDTFPSAAYAHYLTKHIQQSLGESLTDLSDKKLRLLRRQCKVWSPKISPRILCCHTIPDDYQIGDTLILPNGVYQMRMNSAGKIIKETLIDAQNMSMTKHLGLLRHLPPAQTDVLILDRHSKKLEKEAHTTLRQSLNAIILTKPKGMYLVNIANHSDNSYGAIPIALKKIVKAELHTRLLRQYQNQHRQTTFLKFSGFFQSTNKAIPSASSQMDTKQLHAATQRLRALQNQDPLDTDLEARKTTENSQKMDTKTLRAAAEHLKYLQKADPIVQTVTPSPASMLIHSRTPAKRPRILEQVESAIQEVVTELQITAGKDSYKPFRDEKKQTIQVLRGKSNTLYMEASTESVVIYKPLLKAKMDDRNKAELFLQALGVPPALGKPDIIVRGGNHALRKAIRQLFQEYQQTEQLLEIEGSERTESDRDSFSSQK
ncbi:MAG: hypothetical protein NTU48_02025 [Legionellales bacterium]|nr:hypothetical protein [Legionellales bacterium]